MTQDELKKAVGEAALKYVVEDAIVGVGSGSTVNCFIDSLSKIKHKIEEAFRRSAEIDAHRVSVEAHDGEVTLRGNVRSWAERDEAQYTAWSAPGVTRVKNEITVSR